MLTPVVFRSERCFSASTAPKSSCNPLIPGFSDACCSCWRHALQTTL